MNNVAVLNRPSVERQLRDRVEELEEEVRQLRASLVPLVLLPREWGLTQAEHRILAAFCKAKGPLSNEQLFIAMSRHSSSESLEQDNLVKVRISRLRKKIKPLGIEIITRWGAGYEMPEQSVAIIKAVLEQNAFARAT